mgnify:CR=1 FL=1
MDGNFPTFGQRQKKIRKKVVCGDEFIKIIISEKKEEKKIVFFSI